MAQPIPFRKALGEWQLYFFLPPSAVLVGTFAYFPALSAVYHSFFEWQGGDMKRFIGTENFRRAWGDAVLWQSFVTISILVVANVLKLIPSIFAAVLIHGVSQTMAILAHIDRHVVEGSGEHPCETHGGPASPLLIGRISPPPSFFSLARTAV